MSEAGGAEGEILLRCARRHLREADGARLRALAAGAVNWPLVLALGWRHALLPLLHLHLGEAAPDLVPPAVLEELRARAAEAAHAGLRLTAALLRLLDRMDAAGVRALPYKGPVLAVVAYGSVGLRSFSDLDVLVPLPELDRAAGVLEAEGYRPRYRFTPRQDAAFRRVDGDYPWEHPETGVRVELHARVSSGRFGVPLGTEELWARAGRVPLGGRSIPALSREDLLLVLAVHGCKHRWERLEWICGVAELLRARDEPDWSVLLGRARELGAERMLLLALALARDLLDAPLPPGVSVRVAADPGAAALAAEAAQGLFGRPDPSPTAGNLLFNLRAQQGWPERLRYAARWLVVPTPEDWKSLPLPDPLFPAYSALRPLRLAARYGGRLLGRVG